MKILLKFTLNLSVLSTLYSRPKIKERTYIFLKNRKNRDQASIRKIRQQQKKEREVPTIPAISKAKFTAAVPHFEIKNSNLSYGRCTGCQQVRLGTNSTETPISVKEGTMSKNSTKTMIVLKFSKMRWAQ